MIALRVLVISLTDSCLSRLRSVHTERDYKRDSTSDAKMENNDFI